MNKFRTISFNVFLWSTFIFLNTKWCLRMEWQIKCYGLTSSLKPTSDWKLIENGGIPIYELARYPSANIFYEKGLIIQNHPQLRFWNICGPVSWYLMWEVRSAPEARHNYGLTKTYVVFLVNREGGVDICSLFISQIIKRKGFGDEKLNCEGPEERIKQ